MDYRVKSRTVELADEVTILAQGTVVHNNSMLRARVHSDLECRQKT